jgi:thymidylate kinase
MKISQPKVSGPGLWIALYGPDGAGKSAIAERLRLALAPSFRGIAVHHLRISLRGAKPQPAPVAQPHAQIPRGVALSYLKLIYMLVHDWLGYWLVTLPCVAEGRLVIFDRYFPDYAVDSRRYRLDATTARFASLLGRWAPRPDLQFVLDVPAGELQRRKDELSPAESERQRRAYVARLSAMCNARVVDGDRPLDEVVDEIAMGILKLAQPATGDPTEADFANA